MRDRRRLRLLQKMLSVVRQRESDVLEAVRVLVAASRESTGAVLAALESVLRVLEPSIDAVLVFAPEGDNLACIYAAGMRAEHFHGMRLRRDVTASLPAQAALCGHRVELCGEVAPLIPTDRAALAVPMIARDALAAVVYASACASRIGNADAVVRAVAQAASPYALASEREADRAAATYDGLTGLYTPRAFRDVLARELRPMRLAQDTPLALWFIDTDCFKAVNDRYGHAAGDAVLQRMAALLREHLIEGVDLPARNGGDEFCAILRNVHKLCAIERAQRFCAAVRACTFDAGIAITASVGVAAYPYDAAEPNELLETADAAMYHSKRSGRDRVSFAVERGTFAVYE